MNDSQYCIDIGTRLIEMAQNLYWGESGSIDTSMKDLILEQDEFEKPILPVEENA
jgi:hypothetical protein